MHITGLITVTAALLLESWQECDALRQIVYIQRAYGRLVSFLWMDSFQ
jgi:hypothetical protein